MTGFFNRSEAVVPENKEANQSWYYVPVLEQFRNQTAGNKRMWLCASQSNVVRQFYTSTDSLKKALSSRLGAHQTLSCYKVWLSAEQKENLAQLNNNPEIFTAAISLQSTQIRSLIKLREQEIEEVNPNFGEAVSASASCAA
ncbi:hypothetical protein [Legionella genomosp. 1]|uniref:hypothetical protein n=1 Tax=Legionella genomosp. 1 TaxID=1093625 RepID=UPI001055DDCC|nr:hypothetical protein [Legionella genomosp. 1]